MPSIFTTNRIHEPTAAERAALAANRARILEIETQRARAPLDGPLNVEKDLIQSQLDAYTYPVLTLPTELTLKIFLHFLPPYPQRPPITGRGSPTVLSHICAQWREISLSTAWLWCAVAVSFAVDSKAREEKLRFLETFLMRSGTSRALSIALDCRDMDDAPRLMRPITSRCARWEQITLSAPMSSLRSIQAPLPLLHSLNLDTRDDVPSYPRPTLTATFHRAPRLRRITLQIFCTAHLSILPWSQVTTLTVNRIYPNDCAALLSASANLVYCKLSLHSFTFPYVPASLGMSTQN
jgi:hypothetical protein